jgi:hypothetical protein
MAKKKRSKFGVDQTSVGREKRTSNDYITGEPILFDSELEKKFYDTVIVKGLIDGSISKYKLQQKYRLLPSFKYMGETIREINYISDFDIWYSDGTFKVVDTKGRATADAKIKAKLMKYAYPEIKFEWVSYTVATGWMEYSELEKIRSKKRKDKKTQKDAK